MALDGILDLADDALAGGGAVVGRVLGGGGGFGELAGEHDAAADGPGEAVEGHGGGFWRDCGGGRGGGLGCGRRRFGLAGDLLVQVAGEAGADGDEIVQGLAVELGVRGLLAGGVFALSLGWVCGHEQKKNIVGGVGSRMAWVEGLRWCASG